MLQVKDATGNTVSIKTADDVVAALADIATAAGQAALLAALEQTLTVALPVGAATAARQDAAMAASKAVAIVPSDTADLPTVPVGIYVGTAGDIAMSGSGDAANAAPVVWKSVAAGSLVPLRARRVYATGTTAANLLAVYA